MPRIKYIPARKPKANELAALFRAYRKERGMTSEAMAQALGCSPENVRYQMNKPGDQWNIGALKKYCDVLEIPYEEAMRAAAR